MGQNISQSNDSNCIQTPIEQLLHNLIEKYSTYSNIPSDKILSDINLHIPKLLNKSTHEILSTIQLTINSKKQIDLNSIINYYNDKILIIIKIYNTRHKLISKFHSTHDILNMNKLIYDINKLDSLSKLLVEEIINTTTTSNNKTIKTKYYREHPISQKDLNNIISDYNSL